MSRTPQITATELRSGHLVRVGHSNNYVLVAEANQVTGTIEVTIFNGDQARDRPTLFFEPSEVLHLSPCPGSADLRWPVPATR